MDRSAPPIQSFILKIWLEETVAEAGRARWRGRITHVPSGDQRYVDSLDDVAAFINRYLAAMGVGPRPDKRGRRWWSRWTR